MTLIEIMIVIGVLALMLGMVIIGFSSGRNAETTRKVNQMANLIRYGYDKARVTGVHYRLLIDFDKKVAGLQEGDGRMYLPATDRDGKIAKYDESKEEDRKRRDERAEASFNRSVQSAAVRADANSVVGGGTGGDADVSYDDVLDPYKPHPRKVPRRKPPLFQSFKDDEALSDLAAQIKFGDEFEVISVQTADDLQAIETGQASLYFFPRGRTQEAHIQVQDKDGQSKYTIKVQPLTGRVDIVDGFEDLVRPEVVGDKADDLGNDADRRTF